MICRVCSKPIRFYHETFEEKSGERYHVECYSDISGFISWEINRK